VGVADEGISTAVDCQAFGILRSDCLPALATDLLVAGVDTPSLRELAGIDLGPFDARDAADLFDRVVGEAQVSSHSRAEAVGRAAQVLAVVALDDQRPIGPTLRWFNRMTLTARYQVDDDVMYLFGVADEWGAGWGRSDDEIRIDVEQALERLAGRFERPHQAVVDSVAVSTRNPQGDLEGWGRKPSPKPRVAGRELGTPRLVRGRAKRSAGADRRIVGLIVALAVVIALLGVLLAVDGELSGWFLIYPISLLAVAGARKYGRSRQSRLVTDVSPLSPASCVDPSTPVVWQMTVQKASSSPQIRSLIRACTFGTSSSPGSRRLRLSLFIAQDGARR